MKFKIIVSALLTSVSIYSQTPIGSPPLPLVAGNPNQAVTHANFAWYRGGNFNVGPAGNNNIFGTAWNSPVYHITGGQNRMTLFANIGSNGGSGNGALAINHNPANPITAPTSLLNIGEPTFFGQMPWMRVGTSCALSNDMAYFGLKLEGSDRADAIIAWGNDPQGGWGPDVLRFHHTSSQSELARFAPNGGNGFGNFYAYGSNTQPVRRIEALDADPITGQPSNAPQLRLTYAFNQNSAFGIFSEFQTTSNGDLYLNTRTGPTTNDARSFGFHKFNPQNTVEISAQANSPYLPTGATGSSGLRFTSLTSSKTTLPNGTNGVNSNKVLSVDANGDVVLVNTGFGAPCSSPADIIATQFNASRAVDLNTFNFEWRNGRVGIGTTACTPGNRVEITGLVAAQSGLRFTNLTSVATPVTNPGAGVLSVDANGDVIYVSGATNTTGNNGISITAGGVAQLGVDCSSSIAAKIANRLLTNRMIFMGGNNLIFADGGRVGIGQGITNCTVGNKLEVSSGGGMPYWPVVGTNGSSGLRLTSLTSAKTPVANGTNGVNNTKVLSVDQNGDVVLVNAAGGVFGAPCSLPVTSSNLPSDWRIGMSGFSVNYIGTGNVNIGDIQNCLPGSTSPARLWVRNTFGPPNPTTGFRVDNAPGAGVYSAVLMGNVFIGGSGASSWPGLVFSDQNLKENIVNITSSIDILSKLKVVSYNLKADMLPQLNVDVTKTYGLLAQNVEAVIPELVKDVVVPASYDSSGTITNPSITVKSLNYTGLIPFAIGGIQELNGKQKEMQATLSRDGLSDAQVKTNVITFNALAKIKTLQPVQYNFTNTNVPQLTFKSNTDYGFIAQQLGTVYPELVDTLRIEATYDSLGAVVNPSKLLKTVNYKAMSGLLVRSIQEQQSTIDSLKTVVSKQDSINNAVQQQLANLAALIDGCCHSNNRVNNDATQTTLNQMDIELSDKDAIVLDQNVPNPFAEQTTITYNVPASVGKAQIIFFNTNGQVIQTVDIKTRGKGKVNVFASDLSSGLYNYSLIADGKIIDSKKMVRE